MNIQEIHIKEFPVVIITDTHCNIKNIRTLRELYPNNLLICLGDIVNLFAKTEDDWKFNNLSVQFFIDSKIPCLQGNHDAFLGWELKYDISDERKKYLQKLPKGFRLILPNGFKYLCFHNRPEDLWSFTEENTFSNDQFVTCYPVDTKTKGVIIGHQHRNLRNNIKIVL